MVTKLKIVIDDEAKSTLKQAYEYIKNDSLQNAEKVRKGILQSIKSIIHNPEKYPPDKYRSKNDGSYRAYEMFSYRITYHIQPTEIRVIRIWHTKMNPKKY